MHVAMSCVLHIAVMATSISYDQVDALRHKVASLEDDLKSSTTANSQLQQQLSEVKSSLSSSTRQLTEERNNLQLQVHV
jgi:septal ring factor EnvC (AmiA/AmiB activator)